MLPSFSIPKYIALRYIVGAVNRYAFYCVRISEGCSFMIKVLFVCHGIQLSSGSNWNELG